MFLKSIIYMICAGGNFNYVAQNVATIYNIIVNSDFAKSIDHKQLLFAVALCDLTSYYQKGLLQISDAAYAVDAALTGMLSTNSSVIQHDYTHDDSIANLLVNLTMEILLIIFILNTKQDEFHITNEILKHKESTEKTIQKELSLGTKGRLYKDIFRNTYAFLLCNKNNKNVVLNYDSYITGSETFSRKW